MKAEHVSDDVVQAVEEACGDYPWGDGTDPKETIAAAVNAVGMEVKCPKCGEFVSQK